jgi:hypothetical protein
MLAFNFIGNKQKAIAIILLIIFLGYFAYFQVTATDSLIQGKKTSYLQIEQAGLWLKANTPVSYVIFTKSVPQIAYYSERKVLPITDNMTQFENTISTSKPDLLLLSVFEYHTDWTYNYPEQNNLTVVNAFFMDKQPVVIIYKLK